MAGNGSISALGSWVAVFAVGFAIGYGLMALMVDSPGNAEPTEIAAASADETAAVESPDPETAPTEETGAEDTAPEQGAPEAPATPTPAEQPDEPAQAPADGPDGNAAAPAPDEPPGEDAPAAEPKPETWWDKCRGETCRVDWGGLTGGISVRKGSLTHRATVDWERDFAHTARRGVIPTGKNTRVQLLAVGLDHAGVPAAASVVWTNGGQRLQGVISLAPGDKQITLKSLAP